MNLMKKLKFIVSRRIDPFFNLKMDEKMLYLVGQGVMDEAVRFYKNSDSVILGKYQCEKLEVNIDYCEANSIPVLRRISGGGTVFHDVNNLNVAIYIKEQSMPSHYIVESMKMFSSAIANALTGLGVYAEVGTHGEVTVNGKKVSGCAAAKKFRGFLYHATLLLNTDRKKLHNALTPRKVFIPGRKYVRSNRAVVINLYDVKFIPENVIIKAIFKSFSSIF